MRIEKYKVMSNDKEALSYYLQMVEATADGSKTIVDTTDTMTDVDGEPVTMEYYELVDTPPTPPKTESEILLEERSELIRRLESFDYIGTKIAMGVATIDEYAEEIAETQTIRSRINEIDSLLNP